ncbi:uncharacterized protein G2W53_027088 [Senna tora]|uniref:Uncharacterized protein n=1 Tax=Senna tora TaxID=362788 RepID=A0A834TGH7_9FABA|nr:uncharacterized protein G2W53_027088 [Senna tora]
MDDDVDRRRWAKLKNQSPMGHLFSMQNPTCNCADKMNPMTQGSLPRSFKAIRVGHPAVDHVGRPPAKINESWVHMLVQNEAYDTRKHPKKFQGNPTCARLNLRWTTTWIAVGGRRSKINHPRVNFFFYAKSHVHMRRKNDPHDTRKPPKKFQGDPSWSPSG